MVINSSFYRFVVMMAYIDAVALEATTFDVMLRDIDGANGVYFYHTFGAPVGSPSFKRTYIRFYVKGGGAICRHKPLLKCRHTAGLNAQKDFIVGDFELYIREIGKYRLNTLFANDECLLYFFIVCRVLCLICVFFFNSLFCSSWINSPSYDLLVMKFWLLQATSIAPRLY